MLNYTPSPANTGGILGLSIGFSVLSAVEIVYFATMRIFCKQLRKSDKIGHESCNSGDGDITKNRLTATQQLSRKSALSQLAVLDNSLFLHKISGRKLMANN